MRISIDASCIDPGRSAGIEVFTYGLVNGLVSATSHDIEVQILAGTAEQWQGHVPHPSVRWSQVRVPLRLDGRVGNGLRRWLPGGLRSSSAARLVLNTIRDRTRHKPARTTDLTLYPFAGVPVRADPAVVVVHDLRRLQPQFYQPGYAQMIRRNVARAGAVAVSWPHPFQQVRDAFPAARDKIAMIPPPVFHARPPAFDARPEPGLLLYPSSTGALKNHATLLDAMALLPEYRLSCPGPLVEPHATRLLSRAARPDLRGRVDFPGFVPVEQLRDLYARASIVVVPSMWEAASGAIFEAFSWGLPVACADVEPLRAQVQFAGAQARFFDPDSPGDLAAAVRDVTADHERYAASSVEGSRRLSGRTWEATALEYAKVFEWVVGGRAGLVPQRMLADAASQGQEAL